jgi:hypothetical protein
MLGINPASVKGCVIMARYDVLNPKVPQVMRIPGIGDTPVMDIIGGSVGQFFIATLCESRKYWESKDVKPEANL